MENVFVFTASDKSAQLHLKDTIESSINEALIIKHLSLKDFTDLKKISGGEYYAWGAVPGPNNERNYGLMNIGDFVLVYYDKAYHYYSKVICKITSINLAKEIWGSLPNGDTWEFMYFLSKPIKFHKKVYAESLSNYLPSKYMGFAKIKSEKVEVISNKYGSFENFIVEKMDGPILYDSKNSFDKMSIEGHKIDSLQEIIKREDIQKIIKSGEFWHEKPRQLFSEFLSIKRPPEFYDQIFKDYNAEEKLKYHEFIKSKYAEDSSQYKFCELTGKLIAYFDSNSANKNVWNEYDDKRVYARAGIRMGPWLGNLIKFKKQNNDYKSISYGIENTLEYARNPLTGIPIVSEDHKSLISQHILLKPYQRSTFIADLVKYFRQYNIKIANPENETKIIALILYSDQVKGLWKDSIAGLVAIDSSATDWMNEAIEKCNNSNGMVFWWSKTPTGTTDTLEKLTHKIKRDKFFELFYIVNGFAQYRAEVIDFATDDDYEEKNWKEIDGLAGVENNFIDYSDSKHSAAIVFQVQHFEKLDEPVPVNAFTWYSNFSAPRQDNLQPFTEYNFEPAIQISVQPKIDADISFITELEFGSKDAALLCAIQTKPFILLAGLSGTGKSRLVRSLAYKTCSSKELQGSKPGNFELIMVQPNWHDSSEVVGYETRISGKLDYISTNFLCFIVKARKFPNVPFFLCLDEMNLAPVEQYFAEYLSIVETRRFMDDGMTSDPFIAPQKIRDYDLQMGAAFWKSIGLEENHLLQEDFKANGIQLPANLVVIGTVNMDETTHSFSRKVLDRAMTIEMNDVNLMRGLKEKDDDLSYPDAYYHPDIVLGKLQGGYDAYNGLGKNGDTIISWLGKLNEILDGTAFKLAYRVRDEILVYCLFKSKLANKPVNWLNTSLDEMLTMKLLSRIEGDTSRCKDVLEAIQEYLSADFRASLFKIDQMLKKLDTGYTSYWS
ncbi:hypothetical protein BH10BAC3_BH10BAC3_11840 [soil metagenome]